MMAFSRKQLYFYIVNKKTKPERKVLFWIDVHKKQSIDNYGRYEKELPKVEPKTELFTKPTTIAEMIQEKLEDYFDKESRSTIVQTLVDLFDLSYTKAANTYNKFAEDREVK